MSFFGKPCHFCVEVCSFLASHVIFVASHIVCMILLLSHYPGAWQSGGGAAAGRRGEG